MTKDATTVTITMSTMDPATAPATVVPLNAKM